MPKDRDDRVYLREWRLAKGLTQPELARRTGTVKSEISRLENGSRRMTVEWMSAIAKALGVSAEDLMTVPPIGFGAVSPPPQVHKRTLDDGHERIQMGDVFLAVEGMIHAVVAVTGDDWSGTFSPGDMLIYDTGKKSTNAPGVFAFAIGGETIVRRATPTGDGTLLTCSNPAYPPVPLSSSYRTLGRVVARVHRV